MLFIAFILLMCCGSLRYELKLFCSSVSLILESGVLAMGGDFKPSEGDWTCPDPQ